MKFRQILAFVLALCLIWCAAIAAAEAELPENTAADAEPAEQADEAALQSAEKPAEPQPAEEPAQPAEEPAQPAEEPVQQAEKPTQPSEEQAQPAEKPAQPEEKPAQPAEKPAQPEEKPAQPEEKPAQPEEKPAQPEEKPAQQEEKPAQPAEEPAQPAEEPAQPAEEPVQPAEEPAEEPTETAEEPTEPAEKTAQPVDEPEEPAEEEPAQPAEEESAQLPLPTDGSVTPGKTVTGTISGDEEKVWELELTSKTDLILTTEGLPVRVVILRATDGGTMLKETAPKEGLVKEIRLSQGTYLVCIRSAKEYGGQFTWKLEQKNETGTEPEAVEDSEPVAGEEADAENTEAEPAENADPAVGETAELTETDPSETDLSGADPELTAENDPEEVSADDGNAVPAEAETQTVSVRLLSNLQNGEETPLGTEVVIQAEVTGTDRPFHLLWQYTPDGGETVVNVEEEAGSENRCLRYTLDETNIHYLWRAAVVFD